jgi:hypothetical protein
MGRFVVLSAPLFLGNVALIDFRFIHPGQRIRSDLVGSNQLTKSDRNPGYGPTFGSLVPESDGILVSEFDGN